jgi:sigma-54 dependent transcriptional regulator, acetoin dehydrogenase operon transcriptional activator AcoR
VKRSPIEAGLIARARKQFLESGELGGGAVRDPILTSWRRSRMWGVSEELRELPHQPDVETDGKLVHVAQPVLERLRATLSDMSVSIILTDAHANVLYRWVGESVLNRALDSVWLVPGFSYAERYAGTNGIGTALEENRPIHVFGSEHFSGRLQSLSCAGAPIHNVLNGRIQGVIDVTSFRSESSSLMSALAQQAAAEIEQRIVDQASAPERALLQMFLAAKGPANQPLLTVSDDLVIANTAASRLLGANDHTLVRERALELTASRRVATTDVLLSGGQSATLRSRPVMGPSGVAGAIVVFSIKEAGTESAKSRQASRPVPLPGLAGRSPTWLRVCASVELHCRDHSWLLLTGEAGVGKYAIVEAVHRRWIPTEHLEVIDASNGGDTQWLEHVRARLREPAGTVVLRHVDRLNVPVRRALAGLIGAVSESRATDGSAPWLVATSAGGDLDGLFELFPVTVAVPPLRHHADDVGDLASALIGRFAPRNGPILAPRALHTLMRAPWPGNVAQLEGVIHQVLSRKRAGQIEPVDLPPECHVASHRLLTPWETVERDAIIEALLDADGDRLDAAWLLGISRATIYRKIRDFGIVVESTPTSRDSYRRFR